ncbi:MAG: metalloprotease TldD [Gammaproteobacteria bacterium]|nr:metalloprotease TldD [Gammaproteobacteria bacterium]
MTDPLNIANDILLSPSGLQLTDIDELMGRLAGNKIDYADIYFQHSRQEGWSLEDGKVKSGSRSTDQGVGLRAVSGEKTGFAYSDALNFSALEKAAEAARSISNHGGGISQISFEARTAPALYSTADPLTSLASEDKIKLLQLVEAEARASDPRVSQVMASLASVHDVVLVARSDGEMVADVRPLIRLNITVIAEQAGRREQGSYGGGGRYGYQWLFEEDRAKSFAREAVRQALVNLDAIDSPAGTMTVVLGSGWPGILLHEAIGHGLEGDFNRKGTSAFSGRVGERVASSVCTIVDDGTIPDRRGSLSVDDEGEASQNTVLIENGILKGYMQDSLNARLTGTHSTGNGRRESYAHLPMPRMTNTYMLAGQDDPAEILSSVDSGLYAVNFSGGQVDITSGKFVFSASEAYRIEKGKLGAPVKGATLIGNGPDVLTRVSMVGNDLALDSGIGTCGKDGQSVPVGVGQPTMRIDGLTVGGVEV